MTHTCAKCGSTDISTQWHRDLTDCRYGQPCSGEHMHMTCRKCGYWWGEPPMDHPDAALAGKEGK